MYSYDRSKTAARSVHFSAPIHKIEEMLDDLVTSIDYRISGHGYKSDITGEPILDSNQRRKAETFKRDLQSAKRVVLGLLQDARELDSFMKFY